MFNADPHPAEDGFVAVHESYSRTIICSNGLPFSPPQPLVEKRPIDYGEDRGPSPHRFTGRTSFESPASSPSDGVGIPIVAVVGANESGRESQLAGRIADSLAARGLRVAVARLTGTRRAAFQESCNWVCTRDLADYGYLSTRTCSSRELARLFSVQITDIATSSPDVIVALLEGTLWRPDVRAMLSVIGRSRSASTAVVTAAEPGAALLGHDMVQNARIEGSAIWTPRADGSVLQRDKRIRDLGLTVCGRGSTACAARTVMTRLRRRWVPLGNALLNGTIHMQLAA